MPWRLARVHMVCRSKALHDCIPILLMAFANAIAFQAKEISEHLKKKSAGAEEPGAQKFVWGKKIEKDIASGASISDFSKKAERERQHQREVGAAGY